MWLEKGAPAGIETHFELDGLLPPVTDETPEDPGDLYMGVNTTFNHGNFDDEDVSVAKIEEFVDPSKGWLKTCASYAAVREYLKSEPVLSKFASIKNCKFDPPPSYKS